MEEIFPMAAGLICGLLLGSFAGRRRWAAGLLLAVPAGFLATVVSGEWRISWAFLLVDVPLVAGCAALGVILSRTLVLRRAHDRPR